MTDWNNKEEVLRAIRRRGYLLEYASEELKADREVVMVAVKDSGDALEYASEELRTDREFILEAVNDGGSALQYASEELKNDKEVVLVAVNVRSIFYNNVSALKYASEELKADREVVMAAVKDSGDALEYANEELRADKEVVMAAVKDSGDALEYASEELRADKEVVLPAVKQYGHTALEFADKSIKAVLKTSLMEGNNIAHQAKEFFSEENTDSFCDLNVLVQDHIMNNPEYVIKLLRGYDEHFEFISDTFETFPKIIRYNLDVIKVAVEINPGSIESIPKECINSELFTIIYNTWKNDYCDEVDIEVFTSVLAESSCSEDKDLIKYLNNEIKSAHGTSLPYRLLDACSSTLFKDKDILLGLLKNLNEEVIEFGADVYGGNDYYFHWTEVISCEHFSKKMQGSGLLKDPDIIDLLKNISIGIEKHFTLMRKENSMHWVENNEDKHWIMLFRELSKG